MGPSSGEDDGAVIMEVGQGILGRLPVFLHKFPDFIL